MTTGGERFEETALTLQERRLLVNPFALFQKPALGHEAGMVVGVNLGDGENSPQVPMAGPSLDWIWC